VPLCSARERVTCAGRRRRRPLGAGRRGDNGRVHVAAAARDGCRRRERRRALAAAWSHHKTSAEAGTSTSTGTGTGAARTGADAGV
jgi:hypothetical protein